MRRSFSLHVLICVWYTYAMTHMRRSGGQLAEAGFSLSTM